MEKKTYTAPVSETINVAPIELICMSGGGSYEEKMDKVYSSGSETSVTPSTDSDGYWMGD